VIGLVQATEAVKLLVGFGEPLIGRLLTYDAVGMTFREVKLRRDPNCPLCGKNPTIKDLSIHMEGAGQVCADDGNSQRISAARPGPSAKPSG
jgi:adenylyltransferase/sulfurtransferase